MSKYKNNQREEVESEIKEVLNDLDSLPAEYRSKRLMQVFDKHIMLNKAPLLITHYDIITMISQAKGNIVSLPGRIEVSNKELSMEDIRFVAILKSLIGYLNSKDALKRLPEIDITQRRSK
jgi:hypothetical protein